MHETLKKKDNNDDDTRKNEYLKGRGGGGRLKYCNVDGVVPLCLRKTEEKNKDGSSSNKKNNEEKNESGSSTLIRMKDGSKSKMKRKQRCVRRFDTNEK